MMKQAIRKTLALAAIGLAGVAATGAAQAGNVHWSIGINLPAVGIIGGNAPVYYPEPQAYYPAPRVVYAPPPVVYRAPPRVVYRHAPVVVHQPYGHYRHHEGRHAGWRGDRDGRGDRDWRGGRGDRDDDRRHRRHGGRDD
jgi:hypothetical protein